MDAPQTRTLLAELLLLIPAENLSPVASDDPTVQHLHGVVGTLLHGDYEQVVSGAALQGDQAQRILAQFPARSMRSVLGELADLVAASAPAVSGQMLAVACLQLFLQNNYTGPKSATAAADVLFPAADPQLVQAETVRLLNIEGQMAYDLLHDPLWLVLALLVFERLQGVGLTLVQRDADSTIERATADTLAAAAALDAARSPVAASLLWWRARALQVHLSVLAEPSDILAAVTSSLLQQQLVNTLVPADAAPVELLKHVQLAFLLESARTGIHAQTEHLAAPFLHKAAEVSQLEFVLTGAKAKRTKFQTFYTSSLVLLARSRESALYANHRGESAPESLQLNSDLLLEKPEYEALDDIATGDARDAKKIRLDGVAFTESAEPRLLPISLTQDDIPARLRELDPNNQPRLSDIDITQLLLRFATIKQTTASGNNMVDEELSAIVNRIVYSATKTNNWAVFGRALWERSVLETSKSRTVERAILQMTSLVEEVGININTRMIPQAQDAAAVGVVSSRLRFIHQLPLMPQWTMDAKLAEKYMSLGVLRSAIDIYERLHMFTEAALCYAAVGDEAHAEKILEERIASHPEDARATSILGDIRQDPALWEKAWAVGRYAKAKASLCRFYYKPPPGSDVQRDVASALAHMQDCLTASPLSYENWFFYGCCGLEIENYELASEAFTRCVSLDDTNSHAWSNLASALLKLDKTKQAFTALKRALQQGEGAKRSWRIFENYLLVAAKLGEWNDVLHATRQLIEIRKDAQADVVIDVPVVERLVQILVEEPYAADSRPSHFQSSCIDLVCNMLPAVNNHSARVWRIVSRVELWQGRPWAALDCAEKAYRSTSSRPDLDTDEGLWADAVEACADLVSAYESLGEMPGKHGAGDVVCKDWRFKARTSVRSLMSKGKASWEDSEGWERLVALKDDLTN